MLLGEGKKLKPQNLQGILRAQGIFGPFLMSGLGRRQERGKVGVLLGLSEEEHSPPFCGYPLPIFVPKAPSTLTLLQVS